MACIRDWAWPSSCRLQSRSFPLLLSSSSDVLPQSPEHLHGRHPEISRAPTSTPPSTRRWPLCSRRRGLPPLHLVLLPTPDLGAAFSGHLLPRRHALVRRRALPPRGCKYHRFHLRRGRPCLCCRGMQSYKGAGGSPWMRKEEQRQRGAEKGRRRAKLTLSCI